jgi:hypothetical protein
MLAAGAGASAARRRIGGSLRGTCTIISTLASSPSVLAASPFAVSPFAWTVLRRSAVSGARSR